MVENLFVIVAFFPQEFNCFPVERKVLGRVNAVFHSFHRVFNHFNVQNFYTNRNNDGEFYFSAPCATQSRPAKAGRQNRYSASLAA